MNSKFERKVHEIFRKAIQGCIEEINELELPIYWPDDYDERLSSILTDTICLMKDSVEMYEDCQT